MVLRASGPVEMAWRLTTKQVVNVKSDHSQFKLSPSPKLETTRRRLQFIFGFD